MSGHDEKALAQRHVALIDLLDRLLSGGVVVTGDLVLSIAEIDLVRISLRAVVLAVREDDRWALPVLAPGAARGEEGSDGDRAAPGAARGEEGSDGDRAY